MTLDPSADDLAAIRQAAADYIEAWYEGDAGRMSRCLHPALAKRVVRRDPGARRDVLVNTDAGAMLEYTRAGRGRATPVEKREMDVTVHEVSESSACARVISRDFVDFLHLARIDGRWQIVNVLWEPRRREDRSV